MSEPPRPSRRRPGGNTTTVTLKEADAGSVESVARILPDPATLAPGTVVLVPAALEATRSLARSVLAALGRTKTAPRSIRCTALVARGYVDVGAGDDADLADVAWGRAPGTSAER